MIDNTTLRGSVEVTVFRGPAGAACGGNVLGIETAKYGGGFYGVGGKVESGETFFDAAWRELREETGVEAISMKFVAGRTLDPLPQDPEKGIWYCAGFIAEIGRQEPRKCEPHTTPFWTTPENMVVNSLFPEWYRWWFDLLFRLDLMAYATPCTCGWRPTGAHLTGCPRVSP